MFKAFIIFLVMALRGSAQDRAPSTVPENLRPPADQRLLLQAHGIGDQIYTCKPTETNHAWTLKAPDAQLMGSEGKVVGRHFGGPTWEAKDGSRVVGKAAASAASPDPHSVPWLLLDAIKHDGQGVMSDVLSIQRLDTKGGKAPTEGCDSSHAGVEARVPYEAEYYFYGRTK